MYTLASHEDSERAILMTTDRTLLLTDIVNSLLTPSGVRTQVAAVQAARGRQPHVSPDLALTQRFAYGTGARQSAAGDVVVWNTDIENLADYEAVSTGTGQPLGDIPITWFLENGYHFLGSIEKPQHGRVGVYPSVAAGLEVFAQRSARQGRPYELLALPIAKKRGPRSPIDLVVPREGHVIRYRERHPVLTGPDMEWRSADKRYLNQVAPPDSVGERFGPGHYDTVVEPGSPRSIHLYKDRAFVGNLAAAVVIVRQRNQSPEQTEEQPAYTPSGPGNPPGPGDNAARVLQARGVIPGTLTKKH